MRKKQIKSSDVSVSELFVANNNITVRFETRGPGRGNRHVTVRQGHNVIHMTEKDAYTLRDSLFFLATIQPYGTQVEEITSTL
jgi:hypothetical protein